MKTLSALRAVTITLCLLFTLVFPMFLFGDIVHAEPRKLPSTQVEIQAKFVEIRNKDILKIGVSFPSSATCLGFLASIQSITNLFTITNTWHSLSLTNFTKINKKSNSVNYAVSPKGVMKIKTEN
jgi:hypothetical protein